MKIRIIATAMLIFCFCLTGHLYGQQEEMDELFSDISNTPGIAVAAYQSGNVVYKKGFGLRNLDENLPITGETVFEVGGLTMHITATSILRLEDQNRLKLTDPIHQYLTDLPPYAEGTVTIQQLLHHTSGIMDYVIALNMSGKSWEAAFNSDSAYALIQKNGRLGFKPGQEYEYSNSNYVLLGKIVERLSGKSLKSFAAEQLFTPLGMNNTFYYDDAKGIIKNRAIGYSKTEEGFELNHNTNFTSHGDGRLYTTLDDLIIWARNLDNNRLPISNLEKRLVSNGILNNGNKMSYALGLEHGIERGYDFFAHSGYWAGFSAMFLKFPKADFWVLTLSNNSSISAPSKAYDVANVLLDGLPERKESLKKYRVSKKSLEAYVGNYFGYKNGYLREILVENDTLIYKSSPESERKLLPIGKHKFKVLGTISDYTVDFEVLDKEVVKMYFLRDGIVSYEYEPYTRVEEAQVVLDKYIGTYKNASLDITYDLRRSDENTISIFVNNKKLMDYNPVMENLFCSESTHHGYLQFSESGDTFTLSDYSFKPIAFVKM